MTVHMNSPALFSFLLYAYKFTKIEFQVLALSSSTA